MLQLDIPYVYRSNHGMKDDWGIDSYRTPSLYEDPKRSIDAQKKRPVIKHKDKLHFRRLTFVDELQKISKGLPGPDKYAKELVPPEQSIRPRRTRSHSKLKGSGEVKRNDSISEIIKKKLQIPLVGKYNLVLSVEDQQKKFQKYVGRKFTETVPKLNTERYSSVGNAGPGAYNIHLKQFGKSTAVKISPEHRKTNDQKLLFPSVHSYNPIQLYPNFEKSLQLESDKEKKGKSPGLKFSKAQRTTLNPETKELRPSPASYVLLTKWMADRKDKDTKKRNIFKSVSKISSRSIYHD